MKHLYTARDRFEAEIVAGLLKEQGIHPLVKHDDQGGQRPAMNFGQGVMIHVSESDLELGLSVLIENGIKIA